MVHLSKGSHQQKKGASPSYLQSLKDHAVQELSAKHGFNTAAILSNKQVGSQACVDSVRPTSPAEDTAICCLSIGLTGLLSVSSQAFHANIHPKCSFGIASKAT